MPSAAIGVAAYGAGTLIFKDKGTNSINLNEEENLYEILKHAKELTKQLKDLSNQLDKETNY